MTARCVAIFGTASDVGKSITAAALCRIFRRQGLDTAPFKAQNMSNNAFVVPGLGEMARAQVVQAEAAGLPAHPDMNPVLLKPNTETGAQVVVCGRVMGNRSAADYFGDTRELAKIAWQSLDRLRERHERVVIEGAGSCAEVNLRTTDFVNFECAHRVACPVILVADIDRGGVFAQVVGTLEVLDARDRARVAGIIINRFRGDASLFDNGREWLARRTGLPVLGLVPYYRHIHIESEDGLPTEISLNPRVPIPEGHIKMAVVHVPHIANFTDFSPLWREPEVRLDYLSEPQLAANYDLLVLPGSKNVRADLAWLKETGWADIIKDHVARGGRVIGICGGYQMLGRWVADTHGVEGAPGRSEGLGLLPIETELAREKMVCAVRGTWGETALPITGYEIHMGRTRRLAGAPVVQIHARDGKALPQRVGDGTRSGLIWGCYIHGLFEGAAFRQALLADFKPGFQLRYPQDDPLFREQQYDLLADHFSQHLDLARLEQIITGD